MGKKGGQKQDRPRELSLEEQLRQLDANEVPGDPVRIIDSDSGFAQPSAERVAWVTKRNDIVARLRKREGKRLADPGPDEGGRFSPPPVVRHQHGHIIEVAPKELDKELLPKFSQFPKRVTTQRMIDRYKAQGMLTVRQWRAGDRLWRIWRDSGRDPKLIGNYSPDVIRGATDPDAKMIGRTEAVADWENCRRLCGVLGFGVLVDVVIWDQSASDWAASKRTSRRDCATVGMAFLRLGLDTLAAHFRY
ncbi:hypothetical protein [Reyranella sp.]|uniref:hypothetical protein n=1 Tax=Reyranella sp. TaxID=1929291 RepID=UPI002731FD4C|nr:hypothetical protein [Reyranella sp.]MDP2377771.1 hypothetical protein [Reyranella sp.]